MVGPSRSAAETRAMNRRLKLGFVLLVGLSGGLVALQLDPTLPQLGAAVATSLFAGFLLVWYLSRLGRQFWKAP